MAQWKRIQLGTMRFDPWVVGSIPGLAKWINDLALP